MKHTIQEAIQILTRHHDGAVFEIRIPKAAGKNQTASGYFTPNYTGVAEKAVTKYDGGANIYITINPVDSALSARSPNKLKGWMKETSTDKDILRRVHLLIDADPRRAAGISSTDEEKEYARKVIEAIREYLYEKAWPLPIYADSGNGYHLLYRIDLPNDPASNDLVKSCLLALDAKFSTEKVGIDKAVFNAARISKLYGTMACKGESTCDRPHRRSSLIEVPDKFDVVSEELLKELAAQAPVAQRHTVKKSTALAGTPFDMQGFIDRQGLVIAYEKEDSNGKKFILEECPFNPEHKAPDSSLFLHDDGGPGFHCFHDSCSGYGWRELREKLEPGYYDGQKNGNRLSREYHLTDTGNAERFAEEHTGTLRYCRPWKQWMIWTGKAWIEDNTGEVDRLGKATVENILKEGFNADSDEKREKLIKYALSCEKRQKRYDMIYLAQSETGIPVLPSDFDRDTMLLNCNNGIVDLRTGKLRPHNRELLITKIINVSYDPSAECPQWLSFLEKIMNGNQEILKFIQKAVGYSLTGLTKEQILFILHGKGANGKSTFLNTINDLLGNYAVNTPTDTFMLKKNEGVNNDVARLRGARLVTAIESEEGKALAESIVKAMVGGDVIAARFLHAEFFEFKPCFKLWLATNHLPKIRGTDQAIWRRIRKIPFTVTIPDDEQDKDLSEKLKEEFSGILTWAVNGCLLWQQEGLKPPADIVKATSQYKDDMDIIGGFLQEKCILDPTATIQIKELYEAYERWSIENKEKPVGKNTFNSRIADKDCIKERGNSNILQWRGIKLLTEIPI